MRCSCASDDDACGNGEGVHGGIVGDVGFGWRKMRDGDGSHW